MSLKIAILASGRGSNAKAIIQAIQQKQLDAQIQCLICNVENAPVIQLGEEAGIKTFVISHQGLSREQHEAKMLQILQNFEIDYLVLAGYMRLMTSQFLKAFEKDGIYHIINIHPSLLPAFPGTHAYDDAFHYGVKLSGVTVHFVEEAMDSGPIILQESFPRFDHDNLETFKSRGLAIEHQLYPRALQLLAENRIDFRDNPISGRRYVEVKTHVSC